MDERIIVNEAQEFELQFRRLILGVNTSMPGVIVSFDGKFAEVKPAIKMQVTIGNEVSFIELPTIINVPVMLQYAQGAGLVQTLPIKKGDECLLIFSQRAIDNFVSYGGIVKPIITEDQASAKGRNHSLTDAVCIPGLMTGAHLIPNYSLDSIQTRDVSGSTVLSVKSGEIRATVGKTTLSVTPSGVAVIGDISATGTITGGLIKSKAGRNLDTLQVTGVQPGGGVSGVPK